MTSRKERTASEKKRIWVIEMIDEGGGGGGGGGGGVGNFFF